MRWLDAAEMQREVSKMAAMLDKSREGYRQELG